MSMMKKIVVAMLIVSMMLGCFPMQASAATLTEDHGFKIDENLFDVTWFENKKVRVYQTCRMVDGAFDKGVYLGYANVNIGFLTSYTRIDRKIYQRILIDAVMVPQEVKGYKQGMSQLLNIKVQNGGDSLCKNLRIEPASTSGSTTYSTTGNIGGSLGLNVGKDSKTGKLTLGGGANFNLGISRSTGYSCGSLVVTTNVNNSNRGIWNYDYKASNKNATQNAYLLGSSEQSGLYSWNTTVDGNYLISNLKVDITATFGGGNSSTYKVYKNGSSNHLGSKSLSFYIQAYNKNTNYAY